MIDHEGVTVKVTFDSQVEEICSGVDQNFYQIFGQVVTEIYFLMVATQNDLLLIWTFYVVIAFLLNQIF